MDKYEFSDFIYDSRQDAQLTMKELAELLGISWTTIWRWEHRKNCPKPDAIEFWVEKVIDACDTI